MSAIPHGMATLAKELGVTFRMGAPVKRVIVESGRATGVSISVRINHFVTHELCIFLVNKDADHMALRDRRRTKSCLQMW
eukprot:SAG31_NODE_1629_length_7702_cov_6.380902_6_plen_80_part_00